MRLAAGFNAIPTTPLTAAGVSPMAGALQQAPLYYNELQKMAQQQQTTQQMQAQTPFAGQLAQAEALRMFPLRDVAHIMKDPYLATYYPWLANLLGGSAAQQFGRSVPAASGTIPTPLTTRGATQPPTSSSGGAVPVSDQPTWYNSAINALTGGLQSLGKPLGSDNSTPSPSGSNFANTPGSSMQSGVTGSQNGSLMPSASDLKANAPTFDFLNPQLSSSNRGNALTNYAKQEYEAEHGAGSWKKASPQAIKKQIDTIYSSALHSSQNPYG